MQMIQTGSFLAIVALVGALLSPPLRAATLPVKLNHQTGDVKQLRGNDISDVPGKVGLQSGTTIFSGSDGRAEFSVNDEPTLSIGGPSALLLHSVESGILQAALTSGTLHVDSRKRNDAPSRDIRLSVGELRARIADAKIWAEKTPETAQICLVSGVVNFRVGERPLQLDTPNQCVTQEGQIRQWDLVHEEELRKRISLTYVPRASSTMIVRKDGDAPAEGNPPAELAVVAKRPDPIASPMPTPIPAPIAEPEQAPQAPAEAEAIPAALPATPVPAPRAPQLASAEVRIAGPVADVEELEAVAEQVPTMAADPVEEAVPAVPEEALVADVAQAAAVSEREAEPMVEPEVLAAPRPLLTAPSLASMGISLAEPVSAPEFPAEQEASLRAEAGQGEQVPNNVIPRPSVPVVPTDTDAIRTAVNVAVSELDAADSEVDDGRRWTIVLASMPDEMGAKRAETRLRELGMEAEVRQYYSGDKQGFRVGIGRYETRQQGEDALEEFKGLRPKVDAWLAKY